MITDRENGLKRLKRDILPVLARELADILDKVEMHDLEQLEEIRLRADKPLILQNYRKEWFVRTDGCLEINPDNAVTVSQKSISNTLELMSENSIYAFQEEIRNGYLTLRGGHRIGIAGRVVYDGNSIKNIKDVSGLNIRLSNQIIGCAAKIMKYIIKGDSEIYNTLLISPPQCGKTTLLRDIARSLSDGIPGRYFKGVKVGIVDERAEIAACFKGLPQNDVGIRTDVLDGCLKSIGMAMMIRSMSPDVIITDEIGCEGDSEAVLGALNAGVKIITSAHGYNVSELKSRREVLKLLEDKVFERYIVLGNSRGPGTLVEVIDGTTMKTAAGEGCHDI
ncbi:MAG: stage III sporulation protein AA [Ruminiclostridium sp.]|nr:stage III sporulation protein AA [Ruminiclostridium sp.]